MACFLFLHDPGKHVYGVVVYHARRAETNRPEAKESVGRRRHINFVDIPWPINILKFNQAVSEMKPGDQMIAFLKDSDVTASLLQLLRHRPDVGFTILTLNGERCLEVKKDTK